MRELPFDSVYGVELDYFQKHFDTHLKQKFFLFFVFVYTDIHKLQKQTLIKGKNRTKPFQTSS